MILKMNKIRSMELGLLAIRSLSHKKDKALVFSQGRKDLNLMRNVSVNKRELRGI